MIGLPLAILAGAGIGAVSSGVSQAINYFSQKRENQTMRDREDDAVQRRVRDLQLAGLSPTLAAGSPAQAGGATAPNVDLSGVNAFQRALDIKSQLINQGEGRANIAHTNAQTALAQMQTTSELFHQGVMQSEKAGIDLRNSWIDAEQASLIGLRKDQQARLKAQIGEISANTALLKAQTAFEQTYQNYYNTLNDNAKIQGDILINNRSWNDFVNQSEIYKNYASSGSPLKMITGGFGLLGSKMDKLFPRFGLQESENWYHPKR